MKLSQTDKDTVFNLSDEQKTEIVFGYEYDEGIRCDVCILLGGPLQFMNERIKTAARFYKEGRAKYIIATGGVFNIEYNGKKLLEGEYMKEVLKSYGVPEDAIIVEKESRDTKENFLYSTIQIGRTIRIYSVTKVVVMTSKSHLRRSLALAKQYLPRKLEIYGYPAESDIDCKENWTKSDIMAERISTELRELKKLVDGGIIEDIEF